MNISVVICTYNNCKRLGITLSAILQCKIPQGVSWELVIVNNNCTDKTDKVVEEYANTLPISYVYAPNQGLSRARNTGLKNVKGELVVFIDDDVLIPKNWLKEIWAAYEEKPEGYFFGGPIESLFEGENPDDQLLELTMPSIKGLYYGADARELRLNEYFVGANWACPREYVIKAGGFDLKKGPNSPGGKSTSGEETHLMDKLRNMGLIPYYLPNIPVKHFVPVKKTKLTHIARRWESLGYETAMLDVKSYKGKSISGIPLWMYKRYLLFLCKWLLKKVTLQQGYKEYRDLKVFLGKLKAVKGSNSLHE